MENGNAAATHPFGISVSSDDLVETLGFFDNWEDRYRYLIDLGKELPAMEESLKSDDLLIRGCQSQVWLLPREDAGRFYFEVDSDAFIVKGLLALVLAAYNGKSAEQILQFDIDRYFSQLDLMSHLTPTRGNGLRAMVARIRELAGGG